jgi:hypothetical protein
MIDKEIDKFVKMREDIKKDDIIYNQDNLNEKIKTKVSELLFSQLLPYVNNMNEFKVPLKNIVQITETFSQKYKLLTEAQKESIFGLISDNKEIEKIRKECEKNNTLLIKINDNKKTPSNTSTFNAGKDKNIITPNINNDKNKMKNEIMKMLNNNKKNANNESSSINNNINQKNTKPQNNNNNTSSNNNQRTSSIQLGTSSHIQKSNNKPPTPHNTQKNNNNKPNNTNSNNLNSRNLIQKNDIEKSKKEISEKSHMIKEKNISNKDSKNESVESLFGVVLKKIPNK